MNLPETNSVFSPLPIYVSNERRSVRRTPASQDSDTHAGKGQSKRVFVVDDETSIADTLAEILTDSGYEARALYSGHDAITLTRHVCPDIVVTDVVMPAMNGVETALAIKAICPTTRIVLFSGQAGTADILKHAREQGHEFEMFPKPIHPDDLLQILADMK